MMKIVGFYLKSILNIKRYITLSIICISILYARRYLFIGELIQDLLSIYKRPDDLLNGLLLFLTWSLYQFYLLIAIGNFIFIQINSYSSYSITRFCNKKVWFSCVQATITIINLLYHTYSVVFFTFCLILINNTLFQGNHILELIKLILILSITSTLYSNIFIFYIVVIRKVSIAFLVLIATLYAFYFIAHLYDVATLTDPSLIILLLACCVSSCLLNKHVAKTELFHFIN